MNHPEVKIKAIEFSVDVTQKCLASMMCYLTNDLCSGMYEPRIKNDFCYPKMIHFNERRPIRHLRISGHEQSQAKIGIQFFDKNNEKVDEFRPWNEKIRGKVIRVTNNEEWIGIYGTLSNRTIQSFGFIVKVKE